MEPDGLQNRVILFLPKGLPIMQQLTRPQVVLKNSTTFDRFIQPLQNVLKDITPLESGSNRPLALRFEDQIKLLVYYHVQNFDSAHHMLQALSADTFARHIIAPPDGVASNTFYDAIKSRGLHQLQEVFSLLASYASLLIPKAHPVLGDLVAIDPTFIDCTDDMIFAHYREECHKMQAHVGFDPQRTTPCGFVLTDGKADAGDHVEALFNPGQTGIMDRYFQCYRDFSRWHSQGRYFVCRIKENAQKIVLKENPVTPGGYIMSDEWVILGTSQNCTTTPVRLISFRVKQTVYRVATNRFDLTAEQIAEIYRLRWAIETFFGWWKRHMRVYHLISRSPYGLAVQLLAGLITYLLLAIYCHTQFDEKVTIKRVRELQYTIQNESICQVYNSVSQHPLFFYSSSKS
jgi:hypothetical protein